MGRSTGNDEIDLECIAIPSEQFFDQTQFGYQAPLAVGDQYNSVVSGANCPQEWAKRLNGIMQWRLVEPPALIFEKVYVIAVRSPIILEL